MIRPCTPSDLPEVASLHRSAFGNKSGMPLDDLQDYFRQIFFASPWSDPAVPSLVYVADDGRLRGFLGIVPRAMMMGKRRVVVAVGSQFILAADSRDVGALGLVRSALCGSQDLFIADGVSDTVQRLWATLQLPTAWLYSAHWLLPLNPLQTAVWRLRRSRLGERAGLACEMSRHVCAAADRLIAHLRPASASSPSGSRTEELTAEMFLEALEEFPADDVLKPVYTVQTLRWLLAEVARKRAPGSLRKAAVRDTRGRVAGYCVYFAQRGDMAEVVALAARKGAAGLVLDNLLHDATSLGAIGLRGRVSPEFIAELHRRRCRFRFGGPWMLVHSRNPELCTLVQAGQAFLSRLEGEWWMRFHDPVFKSSATSVPQLDSRETEAA